MFVKTFAGLVLCLTTIGAFAGELQGGRVLDSKLHHLGDSEIDFWPEVSKQPEGVKLDITFDAVKNQQEFTLSLTYWDVNYPATVSLNGKKIDQLSPSQSRKLTYVAVPVGALKNGANLLTIAPTPTDDCVVGKISLYPGSFRQLMHLQPVKLTVSDEKGKAVPARVTIVTTNGDPGIIWFAPTNASAVRNRLMYARGTETAFQLSEGDYVIYATRGMEWSRDKQIISVRGGQTNLIKLHLRREVDTTGYVATDTHIHTLTFTGHGDASVDERMLTLAGEGVELAISTDHNHQTDYRPFQKKMLVTDFFTPVTGNEVTTKVGHFNCFPMPPNGPVPNHKENDWVKIVDDARAKGAKVVILNHPRWVPNNVFATNGLNIVTGSRANGIAIPFDGMELVNSCAALPNGFTLFRDWFALLNHGEKIKAVGSSDSHVVDSPVGQGRTYLRSSTDVASKIKVDEVVGSFLKGRSSISFGLYSEVQVENKYGPGDVVPVKSGSIHLKVRVAAPSWITPQRASVFINGTQVAEQKVAIKPGEPTDVWLNFTVPAPRYDAHLVCTVFGDGVTQPCWPTEQDYTLAATNPVFLDANGDGTYQSPRITATLILKEVGHDPESQWQALQKADDGTASQMLDLIYESADGKSRQAWNDRLLKAAGERKLYGDFLESMRETPRPAQAGI